MKIYCNLPSSSVTSFLNGNNGQDRSKSLPVSAVNSEITLNLPNDFLLYGNYNNSWNYSLIDNHENHQITVFGPTFWVFRLPELFTWPYVITDTERKDFQVSLQLCRNYYYNYYSSFRQSEIQ